MEGEGWLYVVVIHLEAFSADYLEPVDDAFGAGEGVEMGVGGEFLRGRDVESMPAEEE